MDIPGFVEAHTRVYEVALLLKDFSPYFCAGDVQEAYRNCLGTCIDFEQFGFTCLEDFLEYGDEKYEKKIFPAPSEIQGLYVCLIKENYFFENKLRKQTVVIDDEEDSQAPSSFENIRPSHTIRSVPAAVDENLNERRPSNPLNSDDPRLGLDHLKFNINRAMLDLLEKMEWATMQEVSDAYNEKYPTNFADDCGLLGCWDLGELAEMCQDQVIIRENEERVWICEPRNQESSARIQKKSEVRNFLTYSEQEVDTRRPSSPRRNRRRRNSNRRRRSCSKSPVRWEHDKFEDYGPRRRRESGERRKREPENHPPCWQHDTRGDGCPWRNQKRRESPLFWVHNKFDERSPSPKREERGRKREKSEEERRGKKRSPNSDDDSESRERKSNKHKKERKERKRSPDSDDEEDRRQRKIKKHKRHENKDKKHRSKHHEREEREITPEVIEIDGKSPSPRREEKSIYGPLPLPAFPEDRSPTEAERVKLKDLGDIVAALFPQKRG